MINVLFRCRSCNKDLRLEYTAEKHQNQTYTATAKVVPCSNCIHDAAARLAEVMLKSVARKIIEDNREEDL